MNTLSVLTIIASYVVMTISLAIANFPTVYARERVGWKNEEALRVAKIDTVFFMLMPWAWLIYLPLPAIVGTVRYAFESQLPK